MPQQKLNHKQSTQVGYELQRTIRAVDGDITDSGISDPRFPKKQNSYFENGTMKEHKTAPKGVVCLFLSLSRARALSLFLFLSRSALLRLLRLGDVAYGVECRGLERAEVE